MISENENWYVKLETVSTGKIPPWGTSNLGLFGSYILNEKSK